MKFALLSTLAFLPLTQAHGDGHSNMMQCVSDPAVDVATARSAVDYYPHKVQVQHSDNWDVSYHGTYKIFTNKASSSTYVLHQCGTEPPASELEAGHAGFIEIPPQNGVNLASTPMITYMELLGLRDSVTGYLGNENFVTSSCFLDLIESGSVGVAADASNATVLGSAGVTDGLTLSNGYLMGDALSNQVVMQEFTETTTEGTMEWIKAYSLFFNMEEKANEVFDEALCRLGATSSNVAAPENEAEKPTMLWAMYSEYCGGWDVAECPNYYCDFANTCGVNILSSSEGSVGQDLCGANYMTDDEFLAFARDADHWIYPNTNWNSIYAEKEAFLAQFKSVQSQTVYDYQGQGPYSWFEQRFAEFDAVLNDFCLVSGTVVSSNPSNKRYWFRNVFTEAVGTADQCEDPSAALEPHGNAWSQCHVETDKEDDTNIGVDETEHDETEQHDNHDHDDHDDHDGHDDHGDHSSHDTAGSSAFSASTAFATFAGLVALFI